MGLYKCLRHRARGASIGVALVVCAWVGLLGAGLEPAARAAVTSGQFTTANGRIYSPDGKEFIARGVNIPGFNYWTGHDPAGDVSKVVDEWRMNFVRVGNQPLATFKAPGYGINLDRVIDAYTARGVVTMVELHDGTGSYLEGAQLTSAANWFAALATKYKNNPYVWFNTANEPGNMAQPPAPDRATPDGAKWLAMNRTIMSAIRATGAGNIVVADGSNWGQDTMWGDKGTLNKAHSAILTYGPTLAKEYSNVVFDTHIYGEWSDANAISQRLPKYIEATRAANLPLVFGEYGATNTGQWLSTASDFLKVANQYGVGRAAWAWSDDGEWQLTTSKDPGALGKSWEVGGGYLINSPTNPTNLTAFGQLVWADTRLVSVPEPTSAAGAAIGLGLALAAVRRGRRGALR